MAPKTRSSVRTTRHSTGQSLPRNRKLSTNSMSSASETEMTPALGRKKSLRRLITIELPAAEARAKAQEARQEANANRTPSPTPATPTATTNAPANETTPSPRPTATPRPWGLGSIVASVRRILSPFPPSKREMSSTIKVDTPSRAAPSLPPPPSTPAPPSTAQKRRLSNDDTSTSKRVKYSARRSARSVRETRGAAADSSTTPNAAVVDSIVHPANDSRPTKAAPSSTFTFSPVIVQSTSGRSPRKSPSRTANVDSSPRRTTRNTSSLPATDVSPSPLVAMESATAHNPNSHSTAVLSGLATSPEPESNASKKRRRIKIDELRYIPSRRPGQSTGTFALLDEFFIEDEDSIEVDENQMDLLSERPSKRTRTDTNVFDLANAQKEPRPNSPKKRTRSTSPTKRSRHMSPEKTSSYLGTPSALAATITTSSNSADKSINRSSFAVPEEDEDDDDDDQQSLAAGDAQTDAQASNGTGQQLDALQRKRSEAEKYKPQVSSRLKEMQRCSANGTLPGSPLHIIHQQPVNSDAFGPRLSQNSVDLTTSSTMSEPRSKAQENSNQTSRTAMSTETPSNIFNPPSSTPQTTLKGNIQASKVLAPPAASPITAKPASLSNGAPPASSIESAVSIGSYRLDGLLTSHVPATTVFEPIVLISAGLVQFPSTSPLSIHVSMDSLPNLTDSAQTDERLASVYQTFNDAVRSFTQHKIC